MGAGVESGRGGTTFLFFIFGFRFGCQGRGTEILSRLLQNDAGRDDRFVVYFEMCGLLIV